MKKLFNKILNLKHIKNFIRIISRNELRVLPGSIAYFLVMSIVPALLLGVLICSKLSFSMVQILDIFNEIIPKDVSELLMPIVSSIKADSVSWWYIILGLLLASNGTHSIILASNTLYGIENKGYLYRRLKSLIMIMVASFVFLFIVLVLGFGNNILKFILSLDALSEIGPKIYSAFIILKWPIAIIVIALLIKVIYTLAPDKKIPSKFVNKGVTFTTIGWVIATALYSYYANNIADYSLIYGSLSSIIVLMIWIYVMAYILVVGIAINTNIYELDDKKSI